MKDMNRRKFIKLSGTMIGSVLLTGCDITSDSGTGPELPNGYRFYRMKTIGETVGSDSRELNIHRFGGSVHISSEGIITFDAYDINGRHGLFQLHVDFDGSAPVIDREHTSVLAGDILEDHRSVRDFAAHDVDTAGNIAAILHADDSDTDQHYGAGLYLDEGGAGFMPIMICGDELNPGRTVSDGIFGDVALCENNGILVIASHTPTMLGAPSGQGIVHFPRQSLGNPEGLMITGDYVAGTDHQIAGFGILDVGNNGNFAVSSHMVPSAAWLTASKDEPEASPQGILSGYVWAPHDHDLFAAPISIPSSRHTGEISYGPRVGADGTVYTKIGGVDGNTEVLVCDDRIIRRTDEARPAGKELISFTPGSVGADGSYYYTQYAKDPVNAVHVTLLAFNGSEHRTVLETGNILSHGGQPVKNIVFSTTTNHIDRDNRVVMLCEFADNSASLVVGLPV